MESETVAAIGYTVVMEITAEAHLGRKPDSVKTLAHFWHFFQGEFLSAGFHPVNGAVVEGFTGQVDNLLETRVSEEGRGQNQ